MHKCYNCGAIIQVFPNTYKTAYFIPLLEVNQNSPNLSLVKLLNDKFGVKHTFYYYKCYNCHASGNALEQLYMMNSPDYLVMELIDQYSISVETKLNISNFKASNEGPDSYELLAVIYYNIKEEEYEISDSKTNNWNNYININLSF